MRTFAALLSAAALLSCGAPASSPSWPRHQGGRGSSVGYSRPPVIDGSRLACLQPPYVPEGDATSVDGGRIERCGDDERSYVVRTVGDEAVPVETLQRVHARLREQGDTVGHVGLGICCRSGTEGELCLRYYRSLCETNVETLAAQVLDALADDPEASAGQLSFVIELSGRTGPRCEASDPACLPVAYDEGRYDPAEPRGARVFESHSAGECRHDGDCVVAGCGNDCVSWEHGGAGEVATCEGYLFPEPIFCGCVRGGCSWFEQ